MGINSGNWHLIVVTNKFHSFDNLEDGHKSPDSLKLNVEALVLPFGLLLNDSTDVGEKEFLDVEWKNLKTGMAYDGDCKLMPQSYQDTGNSKLIPATCHATFTNSSCTDGHLHGMLFSTVSMHNSSLTRSFKRKVLLEFNVKEFAKYQFLRIGVSYIMKCMKCGYTSTVVGISHDTNYSKVLVTNNMDLYMCSFTSKRILHTLSDISRLATVGSSSHGTSIVIDEVLLEEFCCQRSFCLTFESQAASSVILDVSIDDEQHIMDIMMECISALKVPNADPNATLPQVDAQREFIPAWGGVPSEYLRVLSKSESSEGDLVSVCGEVLDVHALFCKSGDLGQLKLVKEHVEIPSFESFSINPGGVCIHVKVRQQLIRIYGALWMCPFPIGLSPAIIATFHRILLPRDQKHEFVLTSSSYITINAVRDVYHRFVGGCALSNALFGSPSLPPSMLSSVSIQHLGLNSICISAEVLVVCGLVIERRPMKHENYCFQTQEASPLVNITLAGFIFDDGSASCCGWAAGENASRLLRLHETASEMLWRRRRFRLFGVQSCHPVSYYLERMLKKHCEIVMKNWQWTSYEDLPSLKFTFFVNSKRSLAVADQHILKFVALKASSGTMLKLTFCRLDSTSSALIKKYMGPDIDIPLKNHFWVQEVGQLDPLEEANNIFNELLHS